VERQRQLRIDRALAGGPEVFVDLAAFARHEHQQRPLLHERLSFELALDRNGNMRARGVRRPARFGWSPGSGQPPPTPASASAWDRVPRSFW